MHEPNAIRCGMELNDSAVRASGLVTVVLPPQLASSVAAASISDYLNMFVSFSKFRSKK